MTWYIHRYYIWMYCEYFAVFLYINDSTQAHVTQITNVKFAQKSAHVRFLVFEIVNF